MKTSKQLTHAYIYADGHAALCYEKHDPDAGQVEFVELHERFTNATLAFKGRIAFSRYGSAGLLRLAKMSKLITAELPRLDWGSDNTKKLGIAVGSLEFNFTGKHTDGEYVRFTTMPNVINCGFSFQPDCDETFDPTQTTWGMMRVAKVHRVPSALEQAA